MGVQRTNWTLFSWKSCLENLDLHTDICFFGDSITRGGKFQKYFPEKFICNLGMTGDTVSGMTARIDMLVSVHPKKVFVMAGINDVLSGGSAVKTAGKYRVLIENIRDSLPDSEILVQSILPVNTKKYGKKVSSEAILEYNKLLCNMAKELSVGFADIYSEYAECGEMPEALTVDGIHLYENAYDRWVNAVKDFMD